MKRYINLLCLLLLVISVDAQNLMPSDGWTIGSGSIGMFTKNGATDENERIQYETPYSTSGIVWRATPGTTSNADGGWHGTHITIPDNTKSYRFCVWIKKTNSIDGRTYFGCNNNNPAQVTTLGGTATTNPYFWSGDLPELDKWFLLVGFVRGINEPASTYWGGIYDGETFEKTSKSVIDYKFKSTTKTVKHRTYLYYDTNTNDRQYFYAPRIDVVDGSEPSIADLLRHDLTQATRPVCYRYDASGNRTDRYLGTILVGRSAKVTLPTDSTSFARNNEAPHVIETSLSEELMVKIYPNPTDGFMRLEIIGADHFDDSGYIIYDANGKTLKEVQSLSIDQNIDIHDWPNAIYVLSLKLNGEISQWKIIKQ